MDGDPDATAWPARGQWCLYLIECANGAWYAGITNDLQRRYEAHASGRGARYTRANPPRRLVGWRSCADRPSALRAEAAIKRLPRGCKLAYLEQDGPPPPARR
ncbi:MAG TPA: GIY-YIG nuclease family protein [Frateuria sp.]|uniref:GIY-YIG nuclease family protein n=1 Tax=Frateuria sp. TaxID=2211372 RepID=UPI002DEAEDF5|nr:GIY-YIG nuclease family protein [Frateuria sp.]